MFDETKIPWLKEGDVAFGKDSSQDPCLPTMAHIGNVVINPNLILHADAFREAADMIVDSLEAGTHPFPPDNLFPPIAYLYRHAIELSLKDAVESAIQIGLVHKDIVKESLEGHNLYELWNILKPALLECCPDEKSSSKNAENIISQFHEMDKSGQAFRYPREKGGRPSLEDKPNLPQIIDLRQLKEVAENLLSFLESCSTYFDELRGADW